MPVKTRELLCLVRSIVKDRCYCSTWWGVAICNMLQIYMVEDRNTRHDSTDIFYLFNYAVITHSPSFSAILLSYVRLGTLKEVAHHCIVLGSLSYAPCSRLTLPRGPLLHLGSVHHVYACVVPTRLAHAALRPVSTHPIILKPQDNSLLRPKKSHLWIQTKKSPFRRQLQMAVVVGGTFRFWA